MAFEYLMAHYLLSCRVDKVAEHIGRLNDFGYFGIPRHYEEALLLYMTKPGVKVDLGDRRINYLTIQRFKAFDNIHKRFWKNKMAALNALVPGFKDTYFFYFIFSGKGKVIEQK